MMNTAISHTPSSKTRPPSAAASNSSTAQPAPTTRAPTVKTLPASSASSMTKRNTASVMPRLAMGSRRFAVCVMRSAAP